MITTAELLAGVKDRISRVEAFEFIRKQAEHMGVKVYLAGGTSFGFLSYVTWDIQQKKGSTVLRADYFDYDLTSIFSSGQDFDIVVDGTNEQIDQLEGMVKAKFNFVIGEVSRWEIRPLRQSRGTPGTPSFKEALLGDFDFQSQNTDTASTGLVEITNSSDSPIRDLRDWTSPVPNLFINNLIGRKITFIRSTSHQRTTRYKKGQNPEIISVIRAVGKAAQYLLNVDEDSKRQMKNIVDQMSAAKVKENRIALDRLIRLGKKIFMNAMSVQYAWDLAESIGLRKALMQFDDPNAIGSLAWWMNKSPLRGRRVGEGSGRTAKMLGLEVLTHATDSFEAYESISRSVYGFPNAFLSREGARGERAALGPGFYLKNGKRGDLSAKGYEGTKQTFQIRFRIEPDAREGTDFEIVGTGDFVAVRILNRFAIRVIPESSKMNLPDFFQYLDLRRSSFREDEQAWIERNMRRLKATAIPAQDEAQARQLIREEFARPNPSVDILFLWFSLPVSVNAPELVQDFYRMSDGYGPSRVATILTYPHWQGHSELLRQIFSDLNFSDYEHYINYTRPCLLNLIENTLQQPHWAKYPEFLIEAIMNVSRNSYGERGDLDWALTRLIGQPVWQRHERLQEFVRGAGFDQVTLKSLRAAISRGQALPPASAVVAQPEVRTILPPPLPNPSDRRSEIEKIIMDLSVRDLAIVSAACERAGKYPDPSIAAQLIIVITEQIRRTDGGDRPNTYVLNNALKSLGQIVLLANAGSLRSMVVSIDQRRGALESLIGRSYSYTQSAYETLKKKARASAIIDSTTCMRDLERI